MQTEKMEFESPITEEWFGKAERFTPKQNGKYGWVWEYAQLRFKWVFDRSHDLEEKSLGILKLIAVFATGAWAIFNYLLQHGVHLGWPVKFMIGAAILSLIASGFTVLKAYDPSQHLYPIAEDAALECANLYSDQELAEGKFCQGLAASTEYEFAENDKKGIFIARGVRLAYASVGLFLLAVFCSILWYR